MFSLRHRYLLSLRLCSIAIGAMGLTEAAWQPSLSGQTMPAATQAATAPAVNVAALISSLGSDNADDREAAQQKLVEYGLPAVAALQKAAKDNDDPEIRSRAAAVLSILHDRSLTESSSITLHCNGSTPQEAFDAISAQDHALVMGMGLAVPAPHKPGHTVTLDVVAKPFWETMIEVCRQLKVCPMPDASVHRLRLCPVDRNWLADEPHQIVGPFYIGIESLSRQRTIDLAGPQTQRDDMTLRMNFCVEPKLLVTHVSNFVVDEAVDDAGNSLMPRPLPLDFPKMQLRRAAGPAQVIEVVLPYPQQHAGANLKTLRGKLGVVVATEFQTYEQDDALNTPKISSTLPSAGIKASVTAKDGNFLVTIQCDIGSLSQKQWTTVTNCFGEVSLCGKAGNRLTPLSPVGIHSMSSTHFVAAGSFAGNVAAGDRLRLEWIFPSSFKTVTVPVSFSGLPMP